MSGVPVDATPVSDGPEPGTGCPEYPDGKQKAEVVRRYIQMCLDSFELTNEQRTLVTGMTTKFVTEAAHSELDPAKRAAMQQPMQPEAEKAMALLGPELAPRIFGAKLPISVVIAVKNDPKFT
jgi:hypothetical protein